MSCENTNVIRINFFRHKVQKNQICGVCSHNMWFKAALVVAKNVQKKSATMALLTGGIQSISPIVEITRIAKIN